MMHAQPTITLHTLRGADGSATYVSPGETHTLIVGVNYPLEVPYRSDEQPESTYIEVSLRPHNGVAMVRERYIEDVVRRTLETIVLGGETPRSMLQVTIQVQSMESDDTLPGGVKEGGQGDVEGVLDLVVGAVNAAVVGCLDGGVRMRTFAGAVLVGSRFDGSGLVTSPDVKSRKQCESLHVFGFDSHGQCILMESQGEFIIEDWERAEQMARTVVFGATGQPSVQAPGDSDVDMDDREQDSSLLNVIRQSVTSRVLLDERWKA